MISIIIVNWNAGPQLKTCVDSITQFGGDYVEKIIVVDNGSVDGSECEVENVPNVTLIRAGDNLGFAKACNLGAKYADSEYLLLLNPDAALFEGTLAKVVNFMQEPANEAVGICGVQLIGDDGEVQRTCARFPTWPRLLAKSFGLTAVIRTTDFQMKEWAHDQSMPVDQVMGAFFMIPRALFSRLDGLDERFFVYFEEVDLSYRAAQLGFRSVYLADVQAFHKGGGVSEQVKAHRLFYSLRSRILYASKHFSIIAALLVATATLAIEPISRLVFLLLRGRGSEVRDLWRGYQMLWGWVFAQALRGRFGD